MPSEALLDDLQDLSSALDTLQRAIVLGDPQTIDLAVFGVLELIESLAILHCHIVDRVLRDRRELNHKMGLREISVPIDYEGWWLVVKRPKL